MFSDGRFSVSPTSGCAVTSPAVLVITATSSLNDSQQLWQQNTDTYDTCSITEHLFCTTLASADTQHI